MKVLSFSYCFPSSVRPTWGIFVLQRLAALARHVDLEVASPVPTFPIWTRMAVGLPARVEQHGSLTVQYPRFFYFPRVLKSLDGSLYGWGLRSWMRQRSQRRKPDLLDAHFVWPDGVGVAQLARYFGVPYVITLRGKLLEHMQHPNDLAQCAEALRRAAAVISVSSPMADLAAGLGVPRSRLHVIPNGVDLDRFVPMERAEARRRLGLPTAGRLLLAVAHLKQTKGHDELVKALALLPADIHLIVVGGDVDNGAYRRSLLTTTERLGLSGRLVLAGPQPYDQISPFFSAADVSVLASHREGCPNVVLESLACGTPVVATRVGAVPDLVTPGVNGVIVPARDATGLAAGLHEALVRTWSREAIRASPAVRSWDTIAREVAAVFHDIMSDGHGPLFRKGQGVQGW